MSETPKAARYGKRRAKVPPFARYAGTSVWRKDKRKVREYARFRAAAPTSEKPEFAG